MGEKAVTCRFFHPIYWSSKIYQSQIFSQSYINTSSRTTDFSLIVRRSMRSASHTSRKRSRSRMGSIFSRDRSQSRSSGAGIKSPPIEATPSFERPRTNSITTPMVKHIRRTSSANNKVVDIVTTDVGLRESSWRDGTYISSIYVLYEM